MIRVMRYGLEIAHRIQVICYLREWGWPRIWRWPQADSSWYKTGRRAVFTGYRIGPFDIRVWRERIPHH